MFLFDNLEALLVHAHTCIQSKYLKEKETIYNGDANDFF